jgi:hypothetical protein
VRTLIEVAAIDMPLIEVRALIEVSAVEVTGVRSLVEMPLVEVPRIGRKPW